MRVNTVYNAGGADNRAYVMARGDNADWATNTTYAYRWILPASTGAVNLQLFARVSGSSGTALSESVFGSGSRSSDHDYELETNGTTMTGKLDGGTDPNHPLTNGTITTGTRAGLSHALVSSTAHRWKNFRVDDLAVAGTFTRTASLNAAVLAAKAQSAGMNAALLAAGMAQAFLDAAALGEAAKTSQIQAALRISRTATALLSSVLRVGGANISSLQAALAMLRATTAGLDANLSAEGVAMRSAAFDAALQRALALSGGLDAGLAIALMRAASTDAAISRRLTGTAPLHAALLDSVALAGALDAVLGDVHAPPGARTFNVPGAGARTLVIPPGKRRH